MDQQNVFSRRQRVKSFVEKPANLEMGYSISEIFNSIQFDAV